jgi:hypothetical protein
VHQWVREFERPGLQAGLTQSEVRRAHPKANKNDAGDGKSICKTAG